MKRSTRIALTAVTASGALAGTGVALAAAPSGLPAASAQVQTVTKTDPTEAYKAQLAAAIKALQRQLGELRSEVATARAQLAAALAAEQVAARAAAAQAAATPPRRVVYVTTPAPAPKTHTTTGASGASGDDNGGGHDD